MNWLLLLSTAAPWRNDVLNDCETLTLHGDDPVTAHVPKPLTKPAVLTSKIIKEILGILEKPINIDITPFEESVNKLKSMCKLSTY